MYIFLLSFVLGGQHVFAAPANQHPIGLRPLADKMARALTDYVILMDRFEGQQLSASDQSAQNAAQLMIELLIPSAHSEGSIACAIAGQVGVFRDGRCQYPEGKGPKMPGQIACGSIFPGVGDIPRDKSYGNHFTLACFSKFADAPFGDLKTLVANEQMNLKILKNVVANLVTKRIEAAKKEKSSYSKMLREIEDDAMKVSQEADQLCAALEKQTYPNVKKDKDDCKTVKNNLSAAVDLAADTIREEKSKVEAELAAAKKKDEEALAQISAAKKKEAALAGVKPCADDLRVQTWKKIAESSRKSSIGYSGQNVMSKKDCFHYVDTKSAKKGSSISPIEINQPDNKNGDYTTAHCTVSCDFSPLKGNDRKSYNKDGLNSNIGVLKFVEYRSTKNDSADIRVIQSTCPLSTEVGKFTAGLEDHARGGKGIYLRSLNGQCVSGGSEVAKASDEALAKAINLKANQTEARLRAAPDSEPNALLAE
jgi:hypothetical protein